MSGFTPEWLALREPADATARARQLAARLRAVLARHSGLDVVDLGAGSGANLRYTAPFLGQGQRWLLVDDDAAVLEAVPAALLEWAREHEYTAAMPQGTGAELGVQSPGFGCTILRRRYDLTRLVADTARIGVAAPVRAMPMEWPRRALVTGSALLDLVSEEWLEGLAALCRERESAASFALTYDGRLRCTPQEPEDDELRALVNRHQRKDKGFGPALGPLAAGRVADVFRRHGYRVEQAASDWHIGPEQGSLQLALLDGWHGAAVELAPERRAALEAWLARRKAHVAAARSTLVVGHSDCIAWLPGAGTEMETETASGARTEEQG